MNHALRAAAGLACASLAITAYSQDAPQDSQFHAQATLIPQYELPFHSPYAGPNSFLSRRQLAMSQTYTLYFGKRLSPRLEAYVDTEMARGDGLSDALGMAGYVNGEVIRNPSLSQEMYAARYIARYTLPLSKEFELTPTQDGENQLGGIHLPRRRLVVTAGKMGTNDIFDTNRYANSPRTQFMNWDLINNAAYDYAADTRGYTLGIAAEYINPAYTLRLGLFQMPRVANGIDLDGDLAHAHGDQLELEFHPAVIKGKEKATFRVLGYENHARMGDYREAIAIGQQLGQAPNIVADDRAKRVKYGFSTSIEQPLSDNGDTGLFLRSAWNDGRTESFAYTEAEESVSAGLQVSGNRWKRPKDIWAIAYAQNGLSSAHRDYLAVGGFGFIVGDGRLNYGPEQLVETYYNHVISKGTTLGFDIQCMKNPGYNRDRGPVVVPSVRLHFEF